MRLIQEGRMRNVIWRLMASASPTIIFPLLGLAQFGSIAGVVKG